MVNHIHYRRALPDDAAACIDLRGRTRENAFSAADLAELGITEGSWAAGIRDGALPGHIALDGERMVGYCFGDREGGEIVVLALLPAYEGQGIGRRLLDLSIADLVQAGHSRLILGCAADPAVRSHGFYRYLGWQPTGEIDALGDEVLELHVGATP
ncbi:GNAT family N-acetyltransferase [Stenotrophomonas sp. SRS1]|uniref:GNAT family N-acetyltransferase n=1 Tax=Stenotrophomonas sp. SRS1 TaxID=2870345 RepID=UPI002238317D|nr:GNAT family N-acetyltransferase [Stenotrophomonas sp. SRS1]MCW6026932.1 GNAT family N-acetyltransferase [Stenotrophomonas sp. SRS1]